MFSAVPISSRSWSLGLCSRPRFERSDVISSPNAMIRCPKRCEYGFPHIKWPERSYLLRFGQQREISPFEVLNSYFVPRWRVRRSDRYLIGTCPLFWNLNGHSQGARGGYQWRNRWCGGLRRSRRQLFLRQAPGFCLRGAVTVLSDVHHQKNFGDSLFLSFVNNS